MPGATLAQLQSIINDGSVKNRIVAALSRTAVNIKNEGSGAAGHTDRLAFAKTILASDANAIAGQVIKYVIGSYSLANSTAELADYTDDTKLTDAILQNYVDASINVFAGVAETP